MSRLYGSIDADASKTTATRRAHRNITGHVRGWNSGVEVRAYVDENDRDVFEIYRTGGSNAGAAPRLIARVVGDEIEQRELSVPEQHQLKIARDTLKMPEAMRAVMGGPTIEEAREIIAR